MKAAKVLVFGSERVPKLWLVPGPARMSEAPATNGGLRAVQMSDDDLTSPAEPSNEVLEKLAALLAEDRKVQDATVGLKTFDLILRARAMLHAAGLAAINEDRSDADLDAAMALADQMLAHAEAIIEHPENANREPIRRLTASEARMGHNAQTEASRKVRLIKAAFERWLWSGLPAKSGIGPMKLSIASDAARMALSDLEFELRFDEDLVAKLRTTETHKLATELISSLRTGKDSVWGRVGKRFLKELGFDSTFSRARRSDLQSKRQRKTT